MEWTRELRSKSKTKLECSEKTCTDHRHAIQGMPPEMYRKVWDGWVCTRCFVASLREMAAQSMSEGKGKSSHSISHQGQQYGVQACSSCSHINKLRRTNTAAWYLLYLYHWNVSHCIILSPAPPNPLSITRPSLCSKVPYVTVTYHMLLCPFSHCRAPIMNAVNYSFNRLITLTIFSILVSTLNWSLNPECH